jgi:hypothetical protein
MGAGSFVTQDGAVTAKTAVSGFALTTSATNYLYLDGTASWALTKSTSGFPTTPHLRLAVIVVGSSAITSLTDARWTINAAGSWYDGMAIALGSTTGLQIGTATTQKLGFLNATPVVQQAAGADPLTTLATFGLKAAEGTPSVTGGTGAGTSPTVTTISGSTDRRGIISVVTGLIPTASATIATLTFSTGLTAVPKAILLTPANANAAGVAASVFANSANITTAHFTIDATAVALAATTTYLWHFKVEG